MRLTAVLAFVALSGCLFSQEKGFSTGPSSSWVNSINYPDVAATGSGAMQYLLNDQQTNFATAESFSHVAMRLLSIEGVQNNSDFSISYDPGYQKLKLHDVKVIRDGESIDKLNVSDIKILENESRMDRFIYDGSVTMVLNLKDIRVGDILEYSYTLSGKNEAFPTHDLYYQYLRGTLAQARMYFRVLEHPERPLYLVQRNGAPDPKKGNYKGQKEYVWMLNNVQPMLVDNNLPPWFDPYPMVELSNYSSWEEVVNANLPLYNFSLLRYDDLLSEAASLEDLTGDWQKINRLTDFVQNDIRYLGFEDGRNAYKPHSPEEVLNQRFGDCKDKSYLLCALLRGLGYEAFPMLVNTNVSQEVAAYTCSPFQFNHCVVAFNYNDRMYYIDPTISGAGGEVNERNFPDYCKGLILRPGQKALTDLYANNEGSIHVKQELQIPEDSAGEGIFIIVTEYRGTEADKQRQFFNSESIESVEQSYLDYFSAIYPDLKVIENLEFDDNLKENIFITKETYEVPKIWVYSPELQKYQAESYPLLLEHYAFVDKSPTRTMPYSTRGPINIYHNTTIHLPSEWNVETSTISFDRKNYSYNYRSIYNPTDKTISINHIYKIKGSYIEANEYNEYVKDHDKVKANLGFVLSYDFGRTTMASMASGGALVSGILMFGLAAVVVFGCFYGFRKIWLHYNPAPESWVKKDRAIGGWLFFIALHLLLSPIRYLYDMHIQGDFSATAWHSALFAEGTYSLNLKLYWLLGFVFNLIIVCTQLFLNISFYSRRSFFPKVFAIYAGALLILNLADTIAYNMFMDLPITNRLWAVLAFIVYIIIFIPLLLTAERSKETFTKKHPSSESFNTSNEILNVN